MQNIKHVTQTTNHAVEVSTKLITFKYTKMYLNTQKSKYL